MKTIMRTLKSYVEAEGDSKMIWDSREKVDKLDDEIKSITRVGPGQFPQYTRADFGQEAVGSSPHRGSQDDLHKTDDEPNSLTGR